ncbi:acid protease [Annulohypoxylon moriforme]|nr:acid protease [Annulohypoxylon moriforme]
MSVQATKCDETSPIQVPIRDVQVLPDVPNSFMKGIAASVGTPPQNIVLLPWPELNNTWIYNDGYCISRGLTNDDRCRVWRGNYFKEGISSTWVKKTDIVVAGGATIEAQAQEGTGIGDLISASVSGIDEFVLNSIKGFGNFPVGLPTINWDNSDTMSHAMGMGMNSTIINALFEAGQISSRVWSLFWGRMWVNDDSAVDGSLVFGGYDQQKIIGSKHVQALDFSENTGCWTGMKVSILNITRRRFGSATSLLDPSTEIMACIVPQHPLLLKGPSSILDNLLFNIDVGPGYTSDGLHRYASVFNESEPFGGDLTISLSTGLDIHVSNDQYVVPFVDIGENGARIVDMKQREVLISSLTYSDTAILGRYFLTAAYLMVDLDENTFTLWQARPTSDSKLVGRDGSDCGYAPLPQAASKLSGRSIAGITVSAIVGLAIFGLCVFYLHRSRLLDNAKPLSSLENELHGSPAVTSEVSGQTYLMYEMDGSTLRAE